MSLTFYCPYLTDMLVVLQDINECVDPEGNDCHENSTCTDTFGSYTCTCMLGYSGNGTYCKGTYKDLSFHSCRHIVKIFLLHFCC